jgi:hypothetical protein
VTKKERGRNKAAVHNKEEKKNQGSGKTLIG